MMFPLLTYTRRAGRRIDPASLSPLVRINAFQQTPYQDAAGTSPVTADGQNVLRIPNTGSAGGYFSNATAARRWLYVASGQNGRPGFKTAASTDSRLAHNLQISLPNAYTTFVVCARGSGLPDYRKIIGAETQGVVTYLHVGSGGGGNFAHWYSNGTNNWNTTNEMGANFPPNGEVAVYCTVNNGTSSQCYANGIDCPAGGHSTGTPGVGPFNLQFGGRADDTQFWSGWVYDVVVITSALASAVIEGVLAWYRSYFNIPKPSKLGIPSFTPLAGNPKIALGAAGSYKETDVASPDGVWDAGNSRYNVSFGGYSTTAGQWKDAVAYTADFVNFTEYAGNPTFAPAAVPNEGYISSNSTHGLVGSTWYKFYQISPPSTTALVSCATSPDFLAWTRLTGSGASGSLPLLDGQATAVFDPQVRMVDATTFELAVMQHAQPANRWCKIVRFTNPLGPYTEVNRFTLGWSGSGAGAPAYWNRGDLLYLHDALPTPASPARQLNIARRFGVGGIATDVTYKLAGPTNVNGSWEKAMRSDCFVANLGGQDYCVYTGAPLASLTEGAGMQVGVAVLG